jgi:hypothetical protein
MHKRQLTILDNSPARVERNAKVIAPGRNISLASFLEQGRSPNLVLLHSTPVPIENAQIVAACGTLSAAVASLLEYGRGLGEVLRNARALCVAGPEVVTTVRAAHRASFLEE